MRNLAFAILIAVDFVLSQTSVRAAAPVLFKPARVFDGIGPDTHTDWVVLVRGERIESAGPADQVRAPADARVIELPNATLIPGLIEAHSHLFLHPYNEASWNDQVLREPLSL